MSADELRAQGNEAFKSGKFAAAVDLYSKAIAADASNAVLYSNRSAAYFELKQYDKAIADGKKSLDISPTAKAHARIGAALWAQNKFDLALASYQSALTLAPNDANTKENISKLRARIAQRGDGPTSGSAFGGGPAPALAGEKADAAIDLAIVFLAAAQILGSIIMPQYATLLWKGLMGAMVARSAVILKRQGLLQPNLESVKSLAGNFAGQYLVLCLIMAFLPIPPMPSLIFAIAIYAVVDIACSQRGAALGLLPLLGKFSDRLDMVRVNRDAILVNAAMCEIGAAFMAMFTGSFMYGMLFLQFFLKYRYRTDSYSKYAWGYLSQMLTKVFYHPRCPPALANIFEKVRNGLHMMATR